MGRKRHIIIASIVLAGGLIGVYVVTKILPSSSLAGSPIQASTASSLIDQATLDQLHQKSPSTIDLSHLADNLTPPTNKWFSGFALQSEPKPGYSYPNSYRPLETGFEMGLPTVSATDDSINGPHRADVVVTIERATYYKLTRYDELTVDISYFDTDNQKLATLTIGSGLPYAFLTATKSIKLTTNLAGLKVDNDLATATVADKTYALYSNDAVVQSPTVSLDRGKLLTIFSAEKANDISKLARYASNRVTAGSVSYSVNSQTTTTQLDYKTTDGKPTMVVRMPHQRSSQSAKDAVVYRSIYGDLVAESTTQLAYKVPTVPVKQSLDLSTLSDEDKALLTKQLERDLAATMLDKPDSYFAGKQLHRAAQLLDMAAQLGVTEQKDDIQSRLKASLVAWLEKNKSGVKSFYYDKELGGIVGNEASFGADKEFNDHHFHYGYFIYAASLLAKYDASFKKDYVATINLLVADIANYKTGEALPLRRSFDPYVGHSWASGIVPFNDGNNQESSSEAIHAWTAVALWADETNNKTLQAEADWMLSSEVASVKEYWLQSNSENVDYLRDYTAPLVSINWGGKRGYQTFFSDEPNAKLGIQLIPMSPTLTALTPAVTDKILSSHTPTGMFSDYITMAQADTLTLETAQKLPDSAIDDGNSRTYLYAWMLTH